MKNTKEIEIHISDRRFAKNVYRKRKKQRKRHKTHVRFLKNKKLYDPEFTYENALLEWLPPNIDYILACDKSIFSFEKLQWNVPNNKGIFKVPRDFSLIDNPKASYKFIQELLAALLTQKYSDVRIDYSRCQRVDLGAQVFLDIILKDVLAFFKRCSRSPFIKTKVRNMTGINVRNDDIRKLLFSVGSPAIHNNQTIRYADIIPYPLCIHDRESKKDIVKIIEQKDIDTTNLVDYVLDSLNRLGKSLSPEKIDDLCTVIGEILINAEEHSTTKYRFSIGYFHEKNENANHYGVFRLVIMNFGNTIYEKFKDPNCPNKDIVEKMKALSSVYAKRGFWDIGNFEEETLWTLYALQEGVTSVAPSDYKKRGNGSIQFIDSFFNLKGESPEKEENSRLTILSGNAYISFDGEYTIKEKVIGEDHFKLMTFNRSNNIEDKPDAKYVKFVGNYFPGTIISAKIIFKEEELTTNA